MNNNSILKVEKPKGSQLNKKAILLIIAIAITIIVIGIILAFTPNRIVRQGPAHFKVGITTDKNSSHVQNLPESYADAKSIGKLIKRGNGDLPDSVKIELQQMRSQQQALQTQLAMLREQKQTPVKPHFSNHNTQLDQEATTSAIFFPGGMPRQEPTKPQQNPYLSKDLQKPGEANSDKTQKGDSYASQNMQGQKLDFLTSKPSKKIYNPNTIQYPASKYILQAGTLIPAILQTKIVSDLPGMITAIVRQNIYDSIIGKYLIVPKGSKLIGEYSSKISYGQNQLQVKFTRLIRPDGTSITLPNQPGVNNMGVSGFKDEVDNHWGKIIGSAALMTVFNIPSIVATNQMNNSGNCYQDSQGNTICNNNLGKIAMASSMQSLGQATTAIGSKISERSLNIQPTIKINAGYEFSVMVTKDTILPPYSI